MFQISISPLQNGGFGPNSKQAILAVIKFISFHSVPNFYFSIREYKSIRSLFIIICSCSITNKLYNVINYQKKKKKNCTMS